MIPSAFDYVRASSVAEAIRLLGERGDDAKVLAGGQSLIPMMKLRFAAPQTLIDIRKIPSLSGISVSGNRVTIGALTTHATIAADATLRTAAPALWDAANVLGDPQVRNLGTIGGSVSHADPSADYPAVMLALEAEYTVAGAAGERRIKAADFFRGMFETSLGEREILTAVSFDAAPASAYVKFHHPASHYAVVGAAAVLKLESGTIAQARVALTGLYETAFRAAAAERALGSVKASDAAAVERATADVAGEGEARSDTFASGRYRKAMAAVYAARAVERAATR
ncbi:MAG: xanthine dehydrogenase family protein subunit M [Candidatus Lustribacter sp.]|jgi:carbon-monoxide dehydrogenase medium subunit